MDFYGLWLPYQTLALCAPVKLLLLLTRVLATMAGPRCSTHAVRHPPWKYTLYSRSTLSERRISTILNANYMFLMFADVLKHHVDAF